MENIPNFLTDRGFVIKAESLSSAKEAAKKTRFGNVVGCASPTGWVAVDQHSDEVVNASARLAEARDQLESVYERLEVAESIAGEAIKAVRRAWHPCLLSGQPAAVTIDFRKMATFDQNDGVKITDFFHNRDSIVLADDAISTASAKVVEAEADVESIRNDAEYMLKMRCP